MTSRRPTRAWAGTERWREPLLALVPWVAFLVTAPVADLFVQDRSVRLGGLAASAPLYLAFVALPSVLPLALARHRTVRATVVLFMTAIAVVASTSIVVTDDAQAGLAVLLVGAAAIPLAVVVGVGEALVAGLRRRARRGAP